MENLVKTKARLFDNSEKLLTYQECAERLQVTVGALQMMVHRREVPFLKVGARVRFLWSQVMESLIEGGMTYGAKSTKR